MFLHLIPQLCFNLGLCSSLVDTTRRAKYHPYECNAVDFFSSVFVYSIASNNLELIILQILRIKYRLNDQAAYCLIHFYKMCISG